MNYLTKHQMLLSEMFKLTMLLDAVKSIYSSPHVNIDDLKEEDLQEEEEEEKCDVSLEKDIYEGVTFAPSEDEDIKRELGTHLVKIIDTDLLRQLGVKSE